MNTSANTAAVSHVAPANGCTHSARNELSRAFQSLERAQLNLSETDKQSALRAAQFHTALALTLMQLK